MRTLTLNKDKFHLPSSWNELTREQLLRIGELAMTNRTPADYKLKLFLKVTNLRVEQHKEVMIDGEPHFYMCSVNRHVHLVSLAALSEVIEALDWMFVKEENAENTERFVLSSRLTRNLIGDIKTPDGVWTGPADYLTNLSTAEYIRAEISFYKYHESQREEYLNALVATLWRPYAENQASTDNRIEFDDGADASRAIAVRQVPHDVCNAILFFYSGSRNALRMKFRHSNESKGEKSSEKDIVMQFLRMINGLAENDVTKHEAIRKAPLMDTLVTIDELARQQKELELKMKKK
jgi:hypothetical protein